MRAIEKLWWRRDEPIWLEALLWPLSFASLFFRAATSARIALGDPHRSRAKVISVGNLAVGGSGKTPVAMLICEALRARGKKPALLSRGYGRISSEEISIVCAGNGPLVDARAAGDEPLLVARRLPWLDILAGSDRRKLSERAESIGAEVLVLDDGLQQRALATDLDIIVVDAKNPLGNRRRVPRGPLREGLEAFDRAASRGLLWLSNSSADAPQSPSIDLQAVLDAAKRAGLRGPIESRAAAGKTALARMVDTSTFLLAGIARPERFEETARSLGLDIRGSAFFADHHAFTEGDLAELRKAALGAGARTILTTEKDAARLSQAQLDQDPKIIPLPIDLQITSGKDELQAALDALLA